MVKNRKKDQTRIVKKITMSVPMSAQGFRSNMTISFQSPCDVSKTCFQIIEIKSHSGNKIKIGDIFVKTHNGRNMQKPPFELADWNVLSASKVEPNRIVWHLKTVNYISKMVDIYNGRPDFVLLFFFLSSFLQNCPFWCFCWEIFKIAWLKCFKLDAIMAIDSAFFRSISMRCCI